MITIYGSSTCSYCKKAIELAKQYKLEYEYKNINNKEYLDEIKVMLPQIRTVPQIYWNGNYVGGYNDLALEIENTRGHGQESL